MKKILVLGALCLILGACQNQQKKTSAPDNTERNVRDRSSEAITPGNQSESAQDREITQRIRRALMDDSSLSTNAKNIKIITINANVTLRGPVKSPNEKEIIIARVREIDGVANVDDQLETR